MKTQLFQRAALALVALALVAAPASAQTSFRDLVRKKIAGELNANVPGLAGTDTVQAMEYTVLLVKTDDADKIVSERPVDPKDHKFKIGDKIRVQVKPLTQMYIYIFHEGTSGEKLCLVPDSTETAPVTEANKVLVLPKDGYFEFSDPPGEEKLVVVGTEKPDVDLALMAGALFKKAGEDLSPAERDEVKKVNSRVDAKLNNVNKALTGKLTYRSLLAENSVKESTRAIEKGEKTQAVLEEAPTAKDNSTFVMTMGPSGKGRPQLLVNIPLKSTK